MLPTRSLSAGSLASCLLAVLVLATPAQAASAAVAGGALRLTGTVGPPTTSTLAAGRGFGPSETVDLTFDQAPIGSATTDPSGAFQTRVKIPATAFPGQHEITATGESSGLSAGASFLVRTDWPMFHGGPARTGFDPYENILDPSTVSGLHVAWKFHDALDASPAVADGRVYVQGFDLEALDARTGAAIWRIDLGSDFTVSSPAVAYGMVYVGVAGDIWALDAATGQQVWTFSTGNAVDASPAVADGTVYIPSLDGNVYALDAATGSLRWRHHTGYYEEANPAVADGVVYWGSADGNLYALDAASGHERWRFPTPAGILASPAVADGVVYVSSGQGDLTGLYALDAQTGAELWTSAPFGNHFTASPAVADGVVYVASPSGRLAALDATSGDLLWMFPASGATFSSVAVANGMVYLASQKRTTFAFGL